MHLFLCLPIKIVGCIDSPKQESLGQAIVQCHYDNSFDDQL